LNSTLLHVVESAASAKHHKNIICIDETLLNFRSRMIGRIAMMTTPWELRREISHLMYMSEKGAAIVNPTNNKTA